MAGTATLHVLLTRDTSSGHEVWIAQCLDHDVIGEGATIDEAQGAFARVLLSEIVVGLERGAALDSVPKAPEELFKLWERAQRVHLGPLAEFPVEGPVADAALKELRKRSVEFRRAN
jgi:hypothetical protein